MILTLQIAVGIWLGGLALAGTVWAGFTVADQVSFNKRRGRPWWHVQVGWSR